MSAEHVPTEKSRGIVQALAQFGIPQEQIASKVGISVKTLTKYYRQEIEDGETAANLKVAQNLYNFASGQKGLPQHQVTAGIFWAKTRMGWRETMNVNNTHQYVGGARERLAGKLGGIDTAPPAEADASFPATVGSA